MTSQNDISTSQRIGALTSLSRSAEGANERPAIAKVFSPLLLAVFFVALLLALIAGVSVYRSITSVQATDNSQREGVGLICNVVRANDAKGVIAAGEGPEGNSLVIVERSSTGVFETRFYEYQGKILQEYSIAGTPYTPEKASVVTESNTFAYSYSKGLLTITTDQGDAEVALRYMQGGE